MAKADWIYGPHTVEAILAHHPERVFEIHTLAGRQDARLERLLETARALSIPIINRERRSLDEQVRTSQHQGVIARVRPAAMRNEADLDALLEGGDSQQLYLILDGVTDPHNLGACLRTAECAGVQGVIVPRDKAAGLSPVVRKVASGAAEVVPVFQVTNLARTMRHLKEKGVWLVGAAIDEGAQPLFKTALKGATAIVMGAEGKGLRRLTKAECDHLVYIPMQGHLSSLNVSVATGVVLFEVLRQRAGLGH